MKARWKAQVGWLLIRSQPFRGLLIFITAITVVVVATSTCISALSWSPQQRANSILGTTEAKVTTLAVDQLRPGRVPSDPQWAAELEEDTSVIPMWSTIVSLTFEDGSFNDISYSELSMPTPILVGKVELSIGRWPSAAGECVATKQATGHAEPPIGEWTLIIVGEVKDIFYPRANEVYCAPGTWQTWHMTEIEQQANNTALSGEFFFLGGPTIVTHELNRLVSEGEFGPQGSFWLETRTQLLSPRGISAQKFLGDRAPLLVLPFGLALVLASLLARWSGVASRALVRAGVPTMPMRRTMATTAMGGTLMASCAGGMIGAFMALLLRPLLAWAKGGVPLSDWKLPINDLALVAGACVIGAGLGLWIGDAVTSARLGQHDRTKKSLSKRAQRTMVLLGIGMVGIALWLILASDGRLWWMISGVLVLVSGTVGFTPSLIDRLGAVLSHRVVSARTLAGRIFVEDSRRWSIIVTSVAVVLGIVCSLFAIGVSTVAGQVALEASQMPAGSVRIETQTPTGDQITEVPPEFRTLD